MNYYYYVACDDTYNGIHYLGNNLKEAKKLCKKNMYDYSDGLDLVKSKVKLDLSDVDIDRYMVDNDLDYDDLFEGIKVYMRED